jgi:hypothetical protein
VLVQEVGHIYLHFHIYMVAVLAIWNLSQQVNFVLDSQSALFPHSTVYVEEDQTSMVTTS